MGKRFAPDLLPDAMRFFEAEGLPLIGRGVWRKTACPFHGGSDSLSVNIDTGGWHCWACLLGGDLIDFAKLRHGLDFMQAAEGLGAVRDDGKPTRPRPATTLSDRAMLRLVSADIEIICYQALAAADAMPDPAVRARFIERVRAVEQVMAEANR